MRLHTYKDLIVWQKSIELVIEIYKLTKKLPGEEIYGLTSQMRRAAVSLPSNVAEGKLRGSDKECRQFFLTAFSSGGELETQVEIAKRLESTSRLDYSEVDRLLSEVMPMLNKLINNLTPNA